MNGAPRVRESSIVCITEFFFQQRARLQGRGSMVSIAFSSSLWADVPNVSVLLSLVYSFVLSIVIEILVGRCVPPTHALFGNCLKEKEISRERSRESSLLD